MARRTNWRRCPHARIAGIYGDAIIYSAYYRLRCLDCGRLLDGPVALANHTPTTTQAKART